MKINSNPSKTWSS